MAETGKMTVEQAIRLLDPATTAEAIAEIEYYNGFSGREAAVQAVSDACEVACEIMREHERDKRWISVKERLPEPGVRVLVAVGAVFEGYIDGNGEWQRYYSAPMKDVLGEPTHWMPLPEPPKEV